MNGRHGRLKSMARVSMALVLALSLGLVMALPAAAVALTVDTGQADTPPNYWVIQDAIVAATAGDTITVAAGTYDERLTIDKQLTLTGAGVTSIVRPTAAPGLNYDVQITSAAGGTIIQGFTFDFNDTGTRGGYGIWVDAADVLISGNTIELGEGVGSAVTGQGVGITARIGQTVDGLIIDGNDFVGAAAAIDNATDGGLGIWLEGTATSLSPITVSNNDFSGPLYAGVGVATNNVAILDNVLTGSDATVGQGFGIGLGVAEAAGLALDNLTVDGNTIDTFGTAIDVLATATDTSVVATITNNTIIDSGEGVYADGDATLTVNYNDITGNTAAVMNDGDVALDAENNWWGVTFPDQVDGETTGVVDSTPWLSAPIAESYVSVSENPELDADFYAVPDSVGVTVYVWADNLDAMAIEEITVAAESSTDFEPGDTEVTLTETGADTGVFTGTVSLIAAAPADRDLDEIVVGEGDTITITYTGQTAATAGIDEVAPVFDTVTVADASYYNNGDTITLTVDLDAAGLTVTADFSPIDSEYTAGDETVTDDTGGAYTVTYAISADNTTADGDHTIPVTAEDDAGNSATDSSASVALDNTAPAVTGAESDPLVIQPDDPTGVTFTATVTDGGIGVDTVTIDLSPVGGSATQAMLDDGASGDGAADDDVYGHVEASLSITDEDAYLLTITAIDLLGNENTADATLSVIDDLDNPVIESTAVEYPIGYESVRPEEDVVISAVATDALSGLDTVTINAEAIGLGATEALTLVAGTYSATLEVQAGTAADTYTLTITATDYAGNSVTSDVDVVVTLVLTGYNIDLAVGWNLISLPLIPDTPAIEVVLADVTVDAVYSYDATTGLWSSYTPGAPSDLATMNDGKAYWVEMSAAATLSIVGNEMPLPPATPPVYSVVEGWNFIGFKSTITAVADDYLAAIAGQYTVIYSFDAADQVYAVVAGTDDLTPGMGYWMAVTEPGNIYP